MKKLTSLLLAFAMLFSLAMPAMAAEDDTATVYFQNNWLWTDVYAYIHYTDGTENAESPGVALEVSSNDGTYDIYSVEFPVSNIDYIIFSGIKSDGTDTRDALSQIPASDLYRNATYSCVWDDGNTYVRTGGEGVSLAGAAPSINGSTTGNVTATYNPTYTVTVNDSQNGEVAANPGRGVAGTEITLTVTPDEGFELDQLIVKDASDGDVTVGAGYTFNMPASNVTVTATFKESATDPEPATKTIYFDNTAGWEKVNAYTWGGVGPHAGWPGSAMTKVEGTESIYSVEVPADASNIIFNNSSAQTPDLTIPTDGKNLYTYSTEMWSVYGSATDPDAPAEITGVRITVDNITYKGSTAENPVVITPTSNVTITVTGTNFSNLTSAYYVFYAWGTTKTLTSSDVTVDTEATPNTASFNPSASAFSNLSEAFEIKYEGDGTDLTSTGIYVIYDSGFSEEELPTVTGVELTDGFASYDETSKTYTITPTSGDVTIKVTGTNFKNLSNANQLYVPGPGYLLLTNDAWTIDTENNIATRTLSNDRFSSLTTAEQFLFEAGDEDVSLGVYLIYKHTYTVTIDENIANGTVTVDKATAAEGETVTVTVEAEAGYAYAVGSLTVTNNSTGEEVEVNEEAKTFVMPASAVTVTASFEKLDTTSADIAWGSMAFTYTDGENGAEGAWSNDVTGGGKVTVTNTGDTTFTAKVTYTAVETYAEITGTFDADSAELAAEASKTFTLSLNGKPNKAITAGTKIGTVTIVIVNDSGSSDEDESDVTIVTSEQELRDAIAQGGKIKLGDSFTISSVDINNNVTLDLNSKTLTTTGNGLSVYYGAILNVSNGTISGLNTVTNIGGTVSVKGCTLTGGADAFFNSSGTSSLKDCTVNGYVTTHADTVTLYENITFGHANNFAQSSGIDVYGGSVICHFDPTGHIHTGSMSDTGNGTWTVSPEAAE